MNIRKFFLVAEACCNHMGNFEIAKKMIKTAKFCDADVIKFQKRKPSLCVPKDIQNKPHPNPQNAFADTYLDHRICLEFSIDEHKKIKKCCEENKIEYSTSVWDLISAEEIINIKPQIIKIPSACNLDFKLIDYIYEKHTGDLHISLGMTTKKERKKIIQHIQKHENRTVLYWTTSGYPVEFNELFLLEIKNLIETTNFTIGYSGHNLGIAVDIAAFTLGATWIERHFTLDRTWKGTDQAASLEPQGLAKLKRNLLATSKALQWKNEDITYDEKENRKKLRVINPDMI
ncbi:MAG: N-acetylneuraminate synthase family protein [Elusimicrobiota bacterium]